MSLRIVDMHSDTAMSLPHGGSLVNTYNFSKKYPQLQFTAIFTPARGKTLEERLEYALLSERLLTSERARLGIAVVKNKSDLARTRNGRSALLSIEGGGGLLSSSSELNYIYERGLRVMGFIWDSNELGASSFDDVDTGLTEEGRRMVRKCAEMGIIIDISHASDKSAAGILELADGPVIATHSNFREVTNHKRNLSRELSMSILYRGGVVGLNLYPPFLSGEKEADFENIFRHIDYAIDTFGEDFLGFGFDIDGTGGEYPRGLDETESIHDKVVNRLLARYGERITEKLAGGNVISFLERNLP